MCRVLQDKCKNKKEYIYINKVYQVIDTKKANTGKPLKIKTKREEEIKNHSNALLRISHG
jgi:hypothetical protein